MPERVVRGVRGATTVDENTSDAILEATGQLLAALQAANGFGVDDVVSALFTATPDLNAGFPATAARNLGWTRTPLLCAVEMAVPGSLPRCVRVLLHVHSDRTTDAVQHVYLRGATVLRPDLE